MNKGVKSTIARALVTYVVPTLLFALSIQTKTVFADNLVVNGDFSNGFAGWTRLGAISRLDIYPSSWCSAHLSSGNPAAGFNVYSGALAAIEQAVELPAGAPYTLTLREWGQYQATTVRVILYDEDDVAYPIDTFTAEQMISGYTYPGPVFQCTGNSQITKSYDISNFAGEIIVIHIEATSTGFDGTFALIDDVTIEGKRGVQGKISYRPESPEAVAGVTVRLSGQTNGGASVDTTTVTDNHGEYLFEVDSGMYTVETVGEPIYVERNGTIKNENGGAFSAEASEGGNCDGTPSKNGAMAKCVIDMSSGTSARANFSYTRCAVDERKPNGKPLTNCPIILVPGFLGSKMACSGIETWPGLPLPGWKQMLLESDGVTNVNTSDCNAAVAPLAGEVGVVDSVAGSDIYQGALDFLKNEAPGRWDASPYDWRKSPVLGAGILEGTVTALLNRTKAKHVVLFGHSMGGLVIREYLNNQSNADKVARVVTAGTPYWGAPKSHFALLGGYTDTPGGSPLDYLTIAADLQLLARNLQGLFFLYPSANLGSWLAVSPAMGRPVVLQGPAGEVEWMSALGASPGLLPNARRWHAANDGFPQTDIDYRAVVGAGSATTQEIRIGRTIDRSGLNTYGDIVIGDGDSTVPIRSATQGASDGGAPLGKNVPIYYACGIGHVALPVNPDVLNNIRYFLTGGEDITGMQSPCPFSGTQILMYRIDLGGGNEINVNPDGFQARSLNSRAAATAGMTLNEAVKQGIVQFISIGNTSIILADDAKPVTITLPAQVAFQIRQFGSEGTGETQSFKPQKTPIVINTGGLAVSSTGGKVKPIEGGGKAPKTIATVVRKNGKVLVKLSAKGTTGVSGTFYQIGKGGLQSYAKPLKIKPGKKPTKIRFFSTDSFGVVERSRKITVK